VIIKRFRSEKEAEKFARTFDYARAYSKLKPLRVVVLEDDPEYTHGVFNPGNIAKTPVPVPKEPVK
jgi:hypothetical protein